MPAFRLSQYASQRDVVCARESPRGTQAPCTGWPWLDGHNDALTSNWCAAIERTSEIDELAEDYMSKGFWLLAEVH